VTGFYKDGKKHGTFTIFSKEGEKLEEKRYQKGNLILDSP